MEMHTCVSGWAAASADGAPAGAVEPCLRAWQTAHMRKLASLPLFS